MSDELKPCPFCGGAAEIDIQRKGFDTRWVTGISIQCVGECLANITVYRRDVPDVTSDDVVDAWNRRTEEQQT